MTFSNSKCTISYINWRSFHLKAKGSVSLKADHLIIFFWNIRIYKHIIRCSITEGVFVKNQKTYYIGNTKERYSDNNRTPLWFLAVFFFALLFFKAIIIWKKKKLKRTVLVKILILINYAELYGYGGGGYWK